MFNKKQRVCLNTFDFSTCKVTTIFRNDQKSVEKIASALAILHKNTLKIMHILI